MAENFLEKFMEDSSDFKNMLDFLGEPLEEFLEKYLEIYVESLRKSNFFSGEFFKICPMPKPC